jgi:hypothetical protein
VLLVIAGLGLGPLVASDPAGAIETRLTPDADARVEQANPSANFGSSSRLVADLAPATESYVRFTVPPLAGAITKATLRLRVENATGDGPKVRATSNEWVESAINWNNRPAALGVLADAGKLARNTWATYDVTAGVTGPGPVSFHLGADSKDGVDFTSRQSSKNRPELVVVTEPPPTTTTTSTTTTSTTTTTTTTTSTTTSTTTTTTTTVPPPTSSTTTTTTTAPPDGSPVAEADEPWLGLARLVTRTCEPTCVQSTYTLSIDDVGPADLGDRRRAFRYPAGQSALLRLEWARSVVGGSGCAAPVEATMDVSLRRPGGARIGSSEWAARIPATCSGGLLRPFDFDSDPMDGVVDDAPYFGVMEVYGRLAAAGAATGADTRGAPPLTPGDAPGRYARGHLVAGGVMVGWHEEGDDPAGLAQNESVLGEPFGLVRSYSPTWKVPSNRVRDWLGQGKFVLWSVKPPVDMFGHDDWTPVSDGTEDAMIRQQVQLLQSWAAAGGTEAGYIFNHEPHDNADIPGVIDKCEDVNDADYPCSGTPAEFIAGYGRIRAIIDELGADRVKLVYTATLSRAAATAPGSAVPGSGDPMTQGDGGTSAVAYSDLIAHDSYNWYCFLSSCKWQFPDSAWARGVSLAEAQGKQLIIAETATHPGCATVADPPGFGCETADPAQLPSPTRDDWLMRIGTWLESDARARRWIVGFAYYHTLHSEDWRFTDQTGLPASGRDGWRNVFVLDTPLNDALGGENYFSQYGFNNL